MKRVFEKSDLVVEMKVYYYSKGVELVWVALVVGYGGVVSLDSVNGGGEQWRPNGMCGWLPGGN
ncbi:hypothetical protein Hdeb2414_s0006g00193141 [Helianthus debilis subsp. tardiflorus]